MKYSHAVPGLLALLAGVVFAGAVPNTNGVDVKQAQSLAEKYDGITHPSGEGTWEKGDVLPTTKPDDAKAWQADGGTITTDKDGMKMVANGGGCYVTVAKKIFKGPVGIRYEAMAPQGTNPCDLSVRFGPATSPNPVAFAFGGYANSQDFFTLNKTRQVLPNAPLITPGQWYSIEVLLGPKEVTASVDGQKVGTAQLAIPIDAQSPHEIALYVWATTGVFRNVQLMKYVPPKADTHTWEQVLGKTTKEDLTALADKVGPLLGNDDYATREAAQKILYELRPLSEAAVRVQMKSKDLEARLRAEKIARQMGFLKDNADGPATQAAPADDYQIELNGGVIQNVLRR